MRWLWASVLVAARVGRSRRGRITDDATAWYWRGRPPPILFDPAGLAALARPSGGGVDVPARAGIAADRHHGGRGGAVHQPNRGLAVGVLPQNVGVAVAVEVTDAGDAPARSRVRSNQRLAERGGAVHQPDCRLAIGVLPQDVGIAVAVEVTRADHLPARSRIATDRRLVERRGPVHRP